MNYNFFSVYVEIKHDYDYDQVASHPEIEGTSLNRRDSLISEGFPDIGRIP